MNINTCCFIDHYHVYIHYTEFFLLSLFLYSAFSLKKTKPPSLVNLCLGILGRYLEDIIADISEIAAGFPPDIKVGIRFWFHS